MDNAFEAARGAVLAALIHHAEREPTIEGLWLQGSLARGDGDAFSDIDAYVAVRDADFDAVWRGRAALLERLGGALAWSDGTTPGLAAVHALMRGGARLDLFFEAASRSPETPRAAVKRLVDKSGVVARLNLGWEAPTPLVARIVQSIIRMTRQGATWPLRVMGRGLWPTLAMMELDLINAQLAQLMAVRHDPANFYRNVFSLPLLLAEAERARLATLTGDALAPLAARDPVAFKAVHLRVLDALVEAGRAACAALGVDYPITEAGEREIRALLEREWPAPK